jgi:hypothetical protein
MSVLDLLARFGSVPLQWAPMAGMPMLAGVIGWWGLYAGLALLVGAAAVGVYLARPARRWPAAVLGLVALLLVAIGLLTGLSGAEPGKATRQVQVSQAPGQPTVYTIALPRGAKLQSYVDPDRSGPNQVHFTFFDAAGNEQPVTRATATATPPAAAARPLELLQLSPGHFVANADLRAGHWGFAIRAELQGGTTTTSSFSHSIGD